MFTRRIGSIEDEVCGQTYVGTGRLNPCVVLHKRAKRASFFNAWKSTSLEDFLKNETVALKPFLLPEDAVIVYLALKWCLPRWHWLHTSDLVLIGCQQDCSEWRAVINGMSEGKAGEDPFQNPPFYLLRRDDSSPLSWVSFVMIVLHNKFFITGIMWFETY